jgi:hypothetical protein
VGEAIRQVDSGNANNTEEVLSHLAKDMVPEMTVNIFLKLPKKK